VMRMEGGAEPPSPVVEIRASLAGSTGAPGLTLEIRDGAAAARTFKTALRNGEADLAAIPLAVLARESGLYAFDRIPFLAATRADARRLFDAAFTPIARRLAEDDLVLLALEPRPATGLLARTPIKRAADFGGKRLWSPDAAARRIAEIAGATPEPEASRADALFVGAAEAMALLRARTLGPGAWTYIRIEGWHPVRAVVISAKPLAALTPDVGQRLSGSASVWADIWWRDEAAGSAAAEQALAEAGHKVERRTDELAADFARIGQQMAAEWMPGAGADGAALLGKIRGDASAR